MIGSFLTRGLVMVFGYAYPAYECYKSVEKNKPEIEQLRFWCQYWILVALLTVFERVGDAFISWVPMYSEAKLAFFIYLWYPKTKGTTYVYDSFFRPYVAKHETDIDRSLLELRTRAGDIAVLFWQRAASYGQTRIYDILQYVAAQSTTPPPRPVQPQGVRFRPPPVNRQAAPLKQSLMEEPPSPTSSTSSTRHQKEVLEEICLSQVPAPGLSTQKLNASTEAPKETANGKALAPKETVNGKALEPKQIEASASSSVENGDENPTPTEMVMEETIRVTRSRLRKTRPAGTNS